MFLVVFEPFSNSFSFALSCQYSKVNTTALSSITTNPSSTAPLPCQQTPTPSANQGPRDKIPQTTSPSLIKSPTRKERVPGSNNKPNKAEAAESSTRVCHNPVFVAQHSSVTSQGLPIPTYLCYKNKQSRNTSQHQLAKRLD